MPRLWAEPACGPFDQRPHGVASQLLGKADIYGGDSLGDPPGRPLPFATTAVPVPADRKLSLYWWWNQQAWQPASSFIFYGKWTRGVSLAWSTGSFPWQVWEQGTVGSTPKLH